jgi:hypothetical protein
VNLLRRITVAVLVIGIAAPAFATPKRLDLKKLLAQPQQKRQEFVPARAGWDGPEQVVKPNAYAQHFESGSLDLRAEWMALLRPDWRVALVLVGLIFGLRQLRRTTAKPQEASYQQPPADTLKAA